MIPLRATLEAHRDSWSRYAPPYKANISSNFSEKLVQQLQEFSKASISRFRVKGLRFRAPEQTLGLGFRV